jgi:hypothetical protein
MQKDEDVKRTYKFSSSSISTFLSLLPAACFRFTSSCSLLISCESTVGGTGSRQEGGIQKSFKARLFSSFKGRDCLPLPLTAVMKGGASPAALWQEAAGVIYQFLCCHILRLLQPARPRAFWSIRIERRSR